MTDTKINKEDMLESVLKFIPGVDWSNPSWDIFIFLLFFVIAFLYGFSLGRDRILVILVSIYIALALGPAFPYYEKIYSSFSAQGAAFKVVSFYIVFIVLFLLLSRSALLNLLGAQSTGIGDNIFEVIIFSILHVGLLVSITLSFLPATALVHLSSNTKEIFTSELGKFLWLIAPIAGMIIFSKHKWGRRDY